MTVQGADHTLGSYTNIKITDMEGTIEVIKLKLPFILECDYFFYL